jgi:hypothetical protein
MAIRTGARLYRFIGVEEVGGIDQWNWWLPSSLARVLPHLSLDDGPRPGSDDPPEGPDRGEVGLAT